MVFGCCLSCLRERRIRIIIFIVLLLILLQYGVNVLIYKTHGLQSFANKLNLRRLWNQTLLEDEKPLLFNFEKSNFSTKNWIKVTLRNNTSTTNISLNTSHSQYSKPVTNGKDFKEKVPSVEEDINQIIATTTVKPDCPVTPPGLVGRIRVKLLKPSFIDLENQHPELKPGGHWQPSYCKSRHRVAIIIPYRDRSEHLRVFLAHMHPFLQKQQLDYSIFVIEETAGTKFNRAMLMNIGYVEASKLYDYQCFVFHDVDLLPEDDRNIYSCSSQPRHLSVAIDKFNYRLPYTDIFGGACIMNKEHFIKINGFSNKYWGWGGEDDDLAARVKHAGFKIIRYPVIISRYKMISHKGDVANPARWNLLRFASKRFSSDGLSSLKYKVVATEFKKLYTLVKVEINQNDV